MKNILYLIFSIVLFSCTTEKEIDVEEKPIVWTQNESSDLNKDFVAEEEAEINAFLIRHADWKTQKTGTGLRYFIYKDEVSDSAQVGMTANVNYSVSLLDGTICYTSDTLGLVSFKIDKDDIESGLHQGIKLMSIGDKAKFIAPSPIAHGLAGDMDKIPPLQAVIYDIELVSLDQ